MGDERSCAAAASVTNLAVHSLNTFETKIVVDLGCCSYQRGPRLEDSIQTLVKRFTPAVLFGFDPHPGLPDAVGQVFGTTVITKRSAAWTYDGHIDLELQGNCTHVVERLDVGNFDGASCFDLVAWFRSLPKVEIVLKIDVEGAEYVLLPELVAAGMTDRLSRILVEWHVPPYDNGYYAEGLRAEIEQMVDCPIEEWQ